LNSGIFGIFIFSFILLANIKILKFFKKDYKIKLFILYLIIFLGFIFLGSGFSIIENFPTFILIILIVNHITKINELSIYNK